MFTFKTGAVPALLGLALALCQPVHATSPRNDVVFHTLTASQLAELRSYPLGTYVGQPGESLAAFLYQLRPVLRAYADKTGFEPCGELARNPAGTQYGIVLASTHSHVGCLIRPADVPPGFQPMHVTYHAHGGRDQVLANRADDVLLGLPDYVGQVAQTIMGQSLDSFSQTDFASGPGYLATPGKVIYQDGNPRGVVTVAEPATPVLVQAAVRAGSR